MRSPKVTSLDAIAAIRAADSHKRYRRGTDRVIAPVETLRKVIPLMPRMGITRLANVTGLDSIGIPVAIAVRPNARSLSTSQGKGLSLTAAKASALMEATELYHAETLTLPLKLNTYSELQSTGHRLVEVNALPRSRVRAFSVDQALPWVEGFNLIDGTTAWLPFELVHTNYTLPARLSSGTFNATSNGLASGNTLMEAVLHGIYEIVERDATALWALGDPGRRAKRYLDLDSVDNPDNCDLLERFSSAGVGVAVWETTSDLGMPAFTCAIVDRQEHRLHPSHSASGMGCHLDRRVALSRALTEAAQSRLTVTAGSRDDVPSSAYPRFTGNDSAGEIRELLARGGGERCFGDVPSYDHETLHEDFEWVVERLTSAGLDEIMVVNLERSDLGIPVVRVVIPGLEGLVDSPDYAMGSRALRCLEAGS
jgi:YcaO-like protein with predicted kinase domain